jgi:hypothetical protein
MIIPKYWAKGKKIVARPGKGNFDVINWQWSEASVDDARQKAESRAAEIAEKVLRGETLDRYGYADRPLREEIKESIQTPFQNEVGIITRNAYGALVLNSANAMFIDIDIPEPPKPQKAGWFGGGGKDSPVADKYLPAVQKVETWAGKHPEYGIRIYATCAGLRCLITNTVFDPKSGTALGILSELESDPLYVRLCKAQECFRARLTPKPWRCGFRQPRDRFPWENPRVESDYRQWEKKYEAVISKYSTCRLIRQLGAPDIDPDIEVITSYHDRVTCVASNLPLA